MDRNITKEVLDKYVEWLMAANVNIDNIFYENLNGIHLLLIKQESDDNQLLVTIDNILDNSDQYYDIVESKPFINILTILTDDTECTTNQLYRNSVIPNNLLTRRKTMKDFEFTREELIAIDAILMIMKRGEFIEIHKTVSTDEIAVDYGLTTYNNAFAIDSTNRTIPRTIDGVLKKIHVRMVEHGMPPDWSIKIELEPQVGEFSMSFFPTQLVQYVRYFE